MTNTMGLLAPAHRFNTNRPSLNYRVSPAAWAAWTRNRAAANCGKISRRLRCGIGYGVPVAADGHKRHVAASPTQPASGRPFGAERTVRGMVKWHRISSPRNTRSDRAGIAAAIPPALRGGNTRLTPRKITLALSFGTAPLILTPEAIGGRRLYSATWKCRDRGRGATF